MAQEDGHHSFSLKESLKAGVYAKVARGEQLTGCQTYIWTHLQRNLQIK